MKKNLAKLSRSLALQNNALKCLNDYISNRSDIQIFLYDSIYELYERSDIVEIIIPFDDNKKIIIKKEEIDKISIKFVIINLTNNKSMSEILSEIVVNYNYFACSIDIWFHSFEIRVKNHKFDSVDEKLILILQGEKKFFEKEAQVAWKNIILKSTVRCFFVT